MCIRDRYERIYKAQEPEAELVCKEQDKEKAVYELKLAYPGEKNYHDAFFHCRIHSDHGFSKMCIRDSRSEECV